MKRKNRDQEFPDNGFEAWGGYMNAKISKLQDQFVKKLSSCKKISEIFKGISIFVNGYTEVPVTELKVLIAEHGGVFSVYQTPNDYIIASNLPDTKVKKLKTDIIKPEWITDSIAANRLLDYRHYLLYKDRHQMKLNFLSKTSTSMRETISYTSSKECDVTMMSEAKDYSLMLKNSSYNRNIENVSESANNTNKQSSSETKAIKDTIAQSETKIQKMNHKERDNTKMTAVDPNFLSEYYNNSRLHHISTLGADMKNFINCLRSKSDFLFPERQDLLRRVQRNKITEPIVTIHSFKGDKVIMHIDMDCFFVSVGLRSRPELRGQPVAVTHSRKGQGYDTSCDPSGLFVSMSEIASCSYEARAKGLRNGMFMGQALKLCPDLKTIQYDFNGYKEVALKLYETISKYTLDIEAVSCDEMYVDCTELIKSMDCDVSSFSSELRKEITSVTQCPCSAGFGGNRLQARLATKKAKPNGQYFMTEDLIDSNFIDLPLKELPGVGRQIQSKLEEHNLKTCGAVRHLSIKSLQEIVGVKFGKFLYDSARACDEKPLSFITVRKSVSTDVNYGIRFDNMEQCETFLCQLCTEVHGRLLSVNMQGKTITLKIMVRAKDAPVQTAKYMGHGICDTINKTKSLINATCNLNVITNEVLQLCKNLKIDPREMRGIGIHIGKLENLAPSKSKNSLETFWNKDLPINSKQISTVTIVKDIENVALVDVSSTKHDPYPKQTVKLNIKPNKLGTTRRKKNKTISNNQISNNKKPELPSQVKISKKNKENDELMRLLSLDPVQVKEMLKAWLVCDGTPLDYDVHFIVSYMSNLILLKRIDKVRVLLIFLSRSIKKKACNGWNKVYTTILNNVQESMLMIYGNKLQLPI